MTILLSNNKKEYTPESLKKVYNLLQNVKAKVANKGIYRYYDSKLKVIASGDNDKSSYKAFRDYVEENPKKRAGKMTYFRVAFECATNSRYLFEDGGIILYASIYCAYINKRNLVNFEVPLSIKSLPKSKQSNVVSSVAYKCTLISSFRLAHMKAMAESQFSHRYKGSLDPYPVTKMYWFEPKV